jgi:hypothetical protein
MITIKEAKTKKELTDYIKFLLHYIKIMNFGYPIIADELESLTRQNPAFDNAEAYFYIAYKNDEIVGRITAM